MTTNRLEPSIATAIREAVAASGGRMTYSGVARAVLDGLTAAGRAILDGEGETP